MNEIIYTVCAAAITASLFTALVPSERYASQIKLIIACYAAAVIASCAGRLGAGDFFSDFSEIDTSYADYSSALKEMTAKETASALRERIKKELSASDITAEKIYIGVNISDSGSISINEIRLVSVDGSEEAALYILRNCVGYETRIFIE